MALNNHQIVEIEKGVSFGKKSGSVIEITKQTIEPDTTPGLINATGKFARWGSDNNRPQRVIDENMQDGTSAGALRFKIMAHIGAGLYFYRQKFENGKIFIEPLPDEEVYRLYPEIEEFDWVNDIENFQQSIVSDFEWHSFFHVQYIPNIAGNKILNVKWQRAKDVRCELRNPNTGEIDNYLLSGEWPQENSSKIAKIPSFKRLDPFKVPNGIHMHRLPSVDKDYYPTPYWQSNLQWLEVAKKIPQWISANIDNSINIKYHIQIPEKYFQDLYPDSRYDSQEAAMAARKTAEEEIKTNIDTMLAGATNASKTFYTKFAMDENGQILPGWSITELKNELKDAAWLNAYGTAAAAIATAHGVPPSLQGLILSNGLGTGSASDTREQFNFYLQLNTIIPRQTTLEPWNFVKRFNKWPKDLHRGYKNIVLQTLDENKSGYAMQNEPNQTSENK